MRPRGQPSSQVRRPATSSSNPSAEVPRYAAPHAGQWLLLGLGTDGSRPLPRWEPGWRSPVTRLRTRAPAGRKDLQGLGGMRVRPDGHVACAWAA